MFLTQNLSFHKHLSTLWEAYQTQRSRVLFVQHFFTGMEAHRSFMVRTKG